MVIRLILRYLAGTLLYALVLAIGFYSQGIQCSTASFAKVVVGVALAALVCCISGHLEAWRLMAANRWNGPVEGTMTGYCVLLWLVNIPMVFTVYGGLFFLLALYPIGVMAMVDFLRRRWLRCLGWHLFILASLAAWLHNGRWPDAQVGFHSIIRY